MARKICHLAIVDDSIQNPDFAIRDLLHNTLYFDIARLNLTRC